RDWAARRGPRGTHTTDARAPLPHPPTPPRSGGAPGGCPVREPGAPPSRVAHARQGGCRGAGVLAIEAASARVCWPRRGRKALALRRLAADEDGAGGRRPTAAARF